MTFNFIQQGVLSEKELKTIIQEKEMYKDKAHKAMITSITGKVKGFYNENKRLSDIYFPLSTEAKKSFNLIQSLIIEQYAGSKLNVGCLSEFQYVRYPIGGKFEWHHDEVQKFDRNNRLRGLTFSLNLSNESEYEGGNLEIKLSKNKVISLNRKKGSYIIFPSFLTHRVNTVQSGIREAIVVWTKLNLDEIELIKKQHEDIYRNDIL